MSFAIRRNIIMFYILYQKEDRIEVRTMKNIPDTVDFYFIRMFCRSQDKFILL